MKKLMYAVTVAVAMVADYLLYIGGKEIGIDMHESAYFGTLVSIWLTLNECISIVENLSDIGVPMPGFLGRILQRVQDKVNDSGDDLAETGNSESDDDAT